MNEPTEKTPPRLPRDVELKNLRSRLVRLIAQREAPKAIEKKEPQPA
jgi:hypothetical protein